MSTKPSARKFIDLDPPHNLIFQRPFNTPKTRELKITNTTDSTIVFKVKTTAPNNYIVVPNCGKVDVKGTCSIEIKRNATNEEFPPDFKCKDKFLVQSMKISEDEVTKYNTSQKDFQIYLMDKFKEIDKQKKIAPQDVKEILGEDRLTCVYQLPSGVLPDLGSVDELNSSRESLATTTVDATSTVTAAPAPVTPAPKSSNVNESEELAAAKEKIKELQQALKGFKQDFTIQELTKGSSTAARDVKATPAQMRKSAPSNKNVIPIEIVVIVALIAFLIGAFCF